MSCIARISLRLLLLSVLAWTLSACASGGARTGGGAAGPRYSGLSCAPFARELSDIALYGEAASWWGAAAGRYQRDDRPVVGGVLVFRPSSRLPSGHVSVVSRIVGARQILVMQANWVPEELDQDQLVVDVSARNDWSEVRVWYPPIGQLGSFAYATYGFILPRRPASYDELARAVRPAAYFAVHDQGRQAPRARLVGG
jgi:surface antigen